MEPIIDDSSGCLRQGIALLQQVDDATYTQPAEACFNSTIGGHLRHNLDHYLCFLAGLAAGRVDYDARLREERLERDRAFAMERMEEVAARLAAIPSECLDQPMMVKVDAGRSDDWSSSSVRRELQFLLSHTIHHYALIGTIAKLHGVRALPEGFGVAPSTLKHHRSA